MAPNVDGESWFHERRARIGDVYEPVVSGLQPVAKPRNNHACVVNADPVVVKDGVVEAGVPAKAGLDPEVEWGLR